MPREQKTARRPTRFEALFNACKEGDADTAQRLLSEGIDVECGAEEWPAGSGKLLGTTRNPPGGTPLIVASLGGYTRTVELLLQAGASVTAHDCHGATAICHAASAGHCAVAELLLASGADARSGSLMFTALDGAAENGHVEMARLLLEAGAEVDSTAICHAASAGHCAVAELLLASGADARSGSLMFTALDGAAENGHVEMARLLLEAGAEVDSGRCEQDGTPHTDGHPLLAACREGHVRMVRLLLAYGANRELLTEADDCVPWGEDDLDAWVAEHEATAHPGEVFAFSFEQEEVLQELRAVRGFAPLDFVDSINTLTAERTRALLAAGADPHAQSANDHLSPYHRARRLDTDGQAAAGSAADEVLRWWRSRVLALAMGTHARLGQHSPVRHLGGQRELLECIVGIVEG